MYYKQNNSNKRLIIFFYMDSIFILSTSMQKEKNGKFEKILPDKTRNNTYL